MIVGICFNHKKPDYLQCFGNEKNEFSPDHDTPALQVGNAVTEHETTDPDNKGDNGELPQVNKGNGKVFQTVYHPEHQAFRPVLQELECRSFIFNKGNLDEKQRQRAQAKQNE